MSRIPFGHDPDDDEPEAPERRYRATHEERVEGPRHAQELAKRLVSMRAAEWPFLGLEDVVLEALQAYASIPSGKGIARKRQLRRLATLMITADLDAIEEAMGSPRKGNTERQDQLAALERERVRIVEGGKEAEEAFIEAHPSVDRQRLRQLAANARKATGEAAVKKANRKLAELLRQAAGV
jgi:ribosome-associated protein